MQLAGISSVRLAHKRTTNSNYSHPIAQNLLERNFAFERLEAYGIRQSTSRQGAPYDSAVAENFFSCLKM